MKPGLELYSLNVPRMESPSDEDVVSVANIVGTPFSIQKSLLKIAKLNG